MYPWFWKGVQLIWGGWVDNTQVSKCTITHGETDIGHVGWNLRCVKKGWVCTPALNLCSAPPHPVVQQHNPQSLLCLLDVDKKTLSSSWWYLASKGQVLCNILSGIKLPWNTFWWKTGTPAMRPCRIPRQLASMPYTCARIYWSTSTMPWNR